MSDKASGRPATDDLQIHSSPERLPRRPAWIEVNLDQLRRNFALIQTHKSPQTALLSVVKADAYGHGATAVAKIALESGASFLAVATLEEAAQLRRHLIQAPILLLGDRPPEELPACLDLDVRCCLSSLDTALELDRLARRRGRPAFVHVKIDTGMSRYGVRWTQAPRLLQSLQSLEWIRLEGLFSHFAMSDELDKTFALEQQRRFAEVLAWFDQHHVPVPCRHLCNSGGFLDLPNAHYDMIRTGILALGVYPSQVCKRIPGIEPVLQVKARIAAIQPIQPGDTVGYGMRYSADSPRRIGVLPLGYGDGFPRIRNQGWVLVHGQRAPIVGSTAMDAFMVDLTHIPQAQPWDEAVLLGRQANETLSVHDLAQWSQTVSYQILSGWRARLPRLYLDSRS